MSKFVLVSLVLLAQGCGTEEPTEKVGEIFGEWASECESDPTEGNTIQTLALSEDSFAMTTEAFAETQCTTLLSTTRIAGDYTSKKEGSLIPIDFVVDSFEITPHTQGMADLFNMQMLGGLNDWSAGQTKSGLGWDLDGTVLNQGDTVLGAGQLDGEDMLFSIANPEGERPISPSTRLSKQ